MIIAETKNGNVYEITDGMKEFIELGDGTLFKYFERHKDGYIAVNHLCDYLTEQKELKYGRIYGVKPKDTFIRIDDIVRIDNVGISISDE